MSDAEWDADDFEPKTSNLEAAKPKTDKWEGEDEDDDVKDSWDKESDDDDDTSKGSEDSNSMKAVQRKKKKKMHEIIAEKEAAKVEEAEKRAQAMADQEFANTPEGKLAEKLRRQKLEEQEALDQNAELFGVKSAGGSGIDAMVPETSEQFDELSKAVVEKVRLFSASSHYNDFVENLIKELTLDLPPATLKKVKIHVETLHTTKSKEEKAATKGGKKKGKGSTVKMDLNKDIFGGETGGGYDEFDDFM